MINSEQVPKKKRAIWLVAMLALFACLVGATLVLKNVEADKILVPLHEERLQAFRIASGGMKPTLEKGDHILVIKPKSEFIPERGDIVVFKAPDQVDVVYVKRIIGLPGDTVEIQSGALHINGNPVPEAYLSEKKHDDTSFGPVSVPEKSLFLLGDNRPASRDSRHFGPIALNQVIGRAVNRHWSWKGKDEWGVRWERIGTPLNQNRSLPQ